MYISFDWRVQFSYFSSWILKMEVAYSKLEASQGSGACDEEADGERQFR